MDLADLGVEGLGAVALPQVVEDVREAEARAVDGVAGVAQVRLADGERALERVLREARLLLPPERDADVVERPRLDERARAARGPVQVDGADAAVPPLARVLPGLMRAALLAVDCNDDAKTRCAMLFFDAVLRWCPARDDDDDVGGDGAAADDGALDALALELGEWAPRFLDRVFGVVEHRDAAAKIPNHGNGASVGSRYQGRKRVRRWPTSKAPISVVSHSFRLIFRRAIISWSDLEA